MTQILSLTPREKFAFYLDHQNEKDEWLVSKLKCSIRTLFRYKKNAKLLSKKASDDKSEEKKDFDPDQTITKELVEFWILSEDKRADLGMKYLQYKDKFSTVIEIDVEDEEDEFEELLTHSNIMIKE